MPEVYLNLENFVVNDGRLAERCVSHSRLPNAPDVNAIYKGPPHLTLCFHGPLGQTNLHKSFGAKLNISADSACGQAAYGWAARLLVTALEFLYMTGPK